MPTLIVVGDEDEPCLEPSFLLKQWIPTSGLVVLPKTGHVVNQEEPALFNEAVADFIARVEAGRWPARDPRSYRRNIRRAGAYACRDRRCQHTRLVIQPALVFAALRSHRGVITSSTSAVTLAW